MKICVLVSDYEESSWLKDVDAPRDPSAYDNGNLNSFEIVHMKKTKAVKQVADLARLQKYDVYLNLCEGCWYDETAGFEVVDALHKLNLPYTGATPTSYQITKQAMKMAAYSCGVSIPNHVFAYNPCDIDWALKQNLNMPVIVKHFNGHDSVGMSERSKVTDQQELVYEAKRLINEFGGALIEEFIEGPEFTVLVLANHESPDDPIALTPAECIFPSGETFKHFDLKWAGFNKIIWKPVSDPALSERLKDASRQIFFACNMSGYARCDFRLRTSTNELFFLEINTNCSIFYNKEHWGSADFILSFDPLGHSGFLELIIKSALKDRMIRRKLVRPCFTQEKGFFVQAIEDIPVGGLVQCHEEKSAPIVSIQHVKKTWGALKQKWLTKYAYPFSTNIFGTWNQDANEWEPINHSCDPNAWLEGLNVVARKKILTGDEVTLDYATFATADFSDEFQCMCKSTNCRKIIRQSDYKDKSFQEQYKNHVSDFVREKIENS